MPINENMSEESATRVTRSQKRLTSTTPPEVAPLRAFNKITDKDNVRTPASARSQRSNSTTEAVNSTPVLNTPARRITRRTSLSESVHVTPQPSPIRRSRRLSSNTEEPVTPSKTIRSMRTRVLIERLPEEENVEIDENVGKEPKSVEKLKKQKDVANLRNKEDDKDMKNVSEPEKQEKQEDETNLRNKEDMKNKGEAEKLEKQKDEANLRNKEDDEDVGHLDETEKFEEQKDEANSRNKEVEEDMEHGGEIEKTTTDHSPAVNSEVSKEEDEKIIELDSTEQNVEMDNQLSVTIDESISMKADVSAELVKENPIDGITEEESENRDAIKITENQNKEIAKEYRKGESTTSEAKDLEITENRNEEVEESANRKSETTTPSKEIDRTGNDAEIPEEQNGKEVVAKETENRKDEITPSKESFTTQDDPKAVASEVTNSVEKRKTIEFSKSWSQPIIKKVTDESSSFIDGFATKQQTPDKEATPNKKTPESVKKSKSVTKRIVVTSDDEESENSEEDIERNEFLNSEAMEAVDDEDSMDSSEREYIAQNEIPIRSESIGSEDTDELTDAEDSEELSSFIVSDEEVDKLSDTDSLYDKEKKPYRRIKTRPIIDSSTDDEKTGENSTSMNASENEKTEEGDDKVLKKRQSLRTDLSVQYISSDKMEESSVENISDEDEITRKANPTAIDDLNSSKENRSLLKVSEDTANKSLSKEMNSSYTKDSDNKEESSTAGNVSRRSLKELYISKKMERSARSQEDTEEKINTSQKLNSSKKAKESADESETDPSSDKQEHFENENKSDSSDDKGDKKESSLLIKSPRKSGRIQKSLNDSSIAFARKLLNRNSNINDESSDENFSGEEIFIKRPNPTSADDLNSSKKNKLLLKLREDGADKSLSKEMNSSKRNRSYTKDSDNEEEVSSNVGNVSRRSLKELNVSKKMARSPSTQVDSEEQINTSQKRNSSEKAKDSGDESETDHSSDEQENNTSGKFNDKQRKCSTPKINISRSNTSLQKLSYDQLAERNAKELNTSKSAKKDNSKIQDLNKSKLCGQNSDTASDEGDFDAEVSNAEDISNSEMDQSASIQSDAEEDEASLGGVSEENSSAGVSEENSTAEGEAESSDALPEKTAINTSKRRSILLVEKPESPERTGNHRSSLKTRQSLNLSKKSNDMDGKAIAISQKRLSLNRSKQNKSLMEESTSKKNKSLLAGRYSLQASMIYPNNDNSSDSDSNDEEAVVEPTNRRSSLKAKQSNKLDTSDKRQSLNKSKQNKSFAEECNTSKTNKSLLARNTSARQSADRSLHLSMIYRRDDSSNNDSSGEDNTNKKNATFSNDPSSEDDQNPTAHSKSLPTASASNSNKKTGIEKIQERLEAYLAAANEIKRQQKLMVKSSQPKNKIKAPKVKEIKNKRIKKKTIKPEKKTEEIKKLLPHVKKVLESEIKTIGKNYAKTPQRNKHPQTVQDNYDKKDNKPARKRTKSRSNAPVQNVIENPIDSIDENISAYQAHIQNKSTKVKKNKSESKSVAVAASTSNQIPAETSKRSRHISTSLHEFSHDDSFEESKTKTKKNLATTELLPPQDSKKRKLNILNDIPFGPFVVQPVTPESKKIVNGFRESNPTPKPIGFKVRSILSAGQKETPQVAVEKPKRRNLRKQLQITDPKPDRVWTSIGYFDVTDSIPSPRKQQYRPKSHGASTDFVVKPLEVKKQKTTAFDSISASALDFKKKALFNDKIRRETATELLQRKNKKIAFKKY